MQYITEREAEQRFNDYLDEINPVITICGMEYLPSRILEEVDPIAYRCLLADYLDGEQLTTDESEAE